MLTLARKRNDNKHRLVRLEGCDRKHRKRNAVTCGQFKRLGGGFGCTSQLPSRCVFAFSRADNGTPSSPRAG